MPARTAVDVGQVADDHVAERDVLLDDCDFGLAQASRLAQDLVRDADLADVVEQAGHVAASRSRRRASPIRRARKARVARDVLRVALRVAILRVDGDARGPGGRRSSSSTASRRRWPRMRRATVSPPLALASSSIARGSGEQHRHRVRVLGVRREPGADGDRQALGRRRTAGSGRRAPFAAARRPARGRPRRRAGRSSRNSSGP